MFNSKFINNLIKLLIWINNQKIETKTIEKNINLNKFNLNENILINYEQNNYKTYLMLNCTKILYILNIAKNVEIILNNWFF